MIVAISKAGSPASAAREVPIWRFLNAPPKELRYSFDSIEESGSWQEFVSRVSKEENLGYEVDEKCGVHYLVDQEFEQNRAATLRGLGSSRFANVRHAFESVYRHFDTDPRDTKAAVRSMFESLEILTKLMVQTNNHNKWIVEHKLKQLAQDCHTNDPTARCTIGTVFDGLADWVDAFHNYRHGQGEEHPEEPPIELAIYAFSSGSAFLRWLLEIDQAIHNESAFSQQ